jgi:hypothetical protein
LPCLLACLSFSTFLPWTIWLSYRHHGISFPKYIFFLLRTRIFSYIILIQLL